MYVMALKYIEITTLYKIISNKRTQQRDVNATSILDESHKYLTICAIHITLLHNC